MLVSHPARAWCVFQDDLFSENVEGNALMVLCPLLPSVSVKLAALNVLLYLSLIAMTLSQPWRVPASNVLDTLLHVGLLVPELHISRHADIRMLRG